MSGPVFRKALKRFSCLLGPPKEGQGITLRGVAPRDPLLGVHQAKLASMFDAKVREAFEILETHRLRWTYVFKKNTTQLRKLQQNDTPWSPSRLHKYAPVCKNRSNGLAPCLMLLGLASQQWMSSIVLQIHKGNDSPQAQNLEKAARKKNKLFVLHWRLFVAGSTTTSLVRQTKISDGPALHTRALLKQQRTPVLSCFPLICKDLHRPFRAKNFTTHIQLRLKCQRQSQATYVEKHKIICRWHLMHLHSSFGFPCLCWLRFLHNSWSMEHATMLPPVVARSQQSPEHDVGCMHLEGKQRIVDGPVEAKASNDSSQVSTSTNQSRHHSQLLLVHEWHNAVAGSFCHLHEEWEANQDSQGNIPWLRIVYQSEAEQEDCLKEEGQELCPNAATEANILEEDVTSDASQGPGKEIHQAKSSCQGGGICSCHLEVCPEMSSLGMPGHGKPSQRIKVT